MWQQNYPFLGIQNDYAYKRLFGVEINYGNEQSGVSLILSPMFLILVCVIRLVKDLKYLVSRPTE